VREVYENREGGALKVKGNKCKNEILTDDFFCTVHIMLSSSGSRVTSVLIMAAVTLLSSVLLGQERIWSSSRRSIMSAVNVKNATRKKIKKRVFLLWIAEATINHSLLKRVLWA
jgi:hypothetical protein